MALEKRGWEAWKAKDAAAFESILAKEVIFVDLFGNSGNSLFTKNRGIGTILNDD